MAGDRLLARDLAALAPDALSPQAPQLDLRLASSPAGDTYLVHQRAGYPFHVGRSLFIPGDPAGMPTLYVQSCSGGIFEHDRLAWQVVAEPGSRAHLTSSASTIVHSMPVGDAVQDVSIEAGPGTLLEYLPDPLVLFSGSRLTSRLTIVAHPDASVFASDAIVPHDPQGRARPFDWFDSRMELRTPDGSVVARDRYRLSGALMSQGVPGVTGNFRCLGSFVALTSRMPAGDLAASIRERVQELSDDAYVGASTLPGGRGAWLRVLARDACALREALRLAWYAARTALLGTPPAPRRK
jgi:urease accessory protein